MNEVSSPVRIAISIGILTVGLLGLWWLGTPEVATRPPDREAAPIVKTAVAEQHEEGIQFEVDGLVVPFREIQIAAEVSGRVEFKSDQCRVGRAVKQGEILIRIDQRDYQLEVKRLNEELNQAEAMLRELDVEQSTVENQIELARQQLDINVRELERQKELVEKRAASESEVDSARRAELQTRNSLQNLLDQKSLLGRRRVRLESAKALVQTNLDKAELSLKRTEIFAPLDGVVVTENVEQDGYVQMGSPVIVLQDTSSLDVTCKLHMRQMNWLWQGERGESEDDLAGDAKRSLVDAYDFPETPATVSYTIGSTEYHWQGVVDRYDGAGIDSQTRMIPCRVHVEDPLAVSSGDQTNPPTLMTGMFVKVVIDTRPPIPLVRIPQEAIQPGNKIWTVDQGKLRRKEALIATSRGTHVVAYQQADGLQAGDLVVISPLASPVEGLPVTEFGKAAAVGRGPGGSGPRPVNAGKGGAPGRKGPGST